MEKPRPSPETRRIPGDTVAMAGTIPPPEHQVNRGSPMQTKRRWLRSVLIAAKAPLPALRRRPKAKPATAPQNRPALAAR